MSDQNWVVPTNAQEFFSQQNRRLGQEERRPSVRKASDLLGPGIAPYAVPLTDFNSDMAAFNGFFIAEPSAPDLNGGPDNTKWWIGQTIADQFNGGWQMFSTFQSADLVAGRHRIMVRSFALAPDSNTRFYSDWQALVGGTDWTYVTSFSGTWSAVSGFPIQYRMDDNQNLIMRGLATGGVAGSTIFTLPAAYRPPRILRPSVYVHSSLSGICSILPTGAVQPGGQGTFSWYSLDLSIYVGPD